jgi:hypothetical protein
MDLKTLLDTPPWEWPPNAGKIFQKILTNPRASESDRIAAAGMAGEIVAINDELAAALVSIVSNAAEPETLRARAAISLGPVLEQSDTDGFEDPDDVPITELAFRNIQDSLQKLYLDTGIPKEVRRRILEASVRAPQDWHADAIRTAWSSGDKDWILTAVFSMRWVRDFDAEILEALKNPDPEIHGEAVQAAGNWGLDAAWSHIVALIENARTPKPLLLDAIEAVVGIRPEEAGPILVDLVDSDDEEIAEAAQEAMAMAEATSGLGEEEEGEDEDEDEWIN